MNLGILFEMLLMKIFKTQLKFACLLNAAFFLKLTCYLKIKYKK